MGAWSLIGLDVILCTLSCSQVLGVGDMDELDNPDFDQVAYINSKFPSEESLSGIDSFLVLSGNKLAALDVQILDAVRADDANGHAHKVTRMPRTPQVREQALHGAAARRDIEDAQASITVCSRRWERRSVGSRSWWAC